MLFESETESLLARYLAFAIVIGTFVISLVFPLVFKHVNTYAAPTAIYANHISETGDLTPPTLESKYWRANIEAEAEFPIPALLVSLIMVVTNAPRDYAMFVPVNGLAAIIFFVLAKRVLCDWGQMKAYGLLFSALSYMYVVSTRIALSSTGRASLGVVLLGYFLFSYVMYLREKSDNARRPWLLVLALFTLVIGYTYYTSSLAILLCTGFMAGVSLLPRIKSELKILRPAFPLAVLSLAVLFYGPLIYTLIGLSGALSPWLFFENFFRYLVATLQIEGTSETSLLLIGVTRYDIFTRVTGVWLAYSMRLASAGAVIYVLISYRPRGPLGKKVPGFIWLFSVTVFLLNLAELGYLFINPILPIRFLFIYGLALMFLLISNFIVKRSGSSADGARNHGGLTRKRVLALSLVIIVVLGSLGSLSNSWNYSSTKPQAYERVEPLSDFILSHSSSLDRVVLTGDADYVADMFFITSLHGKFDSVVPLPLGKDALTLYESTINGEKDQFVNTVRKRGIRFLFLVQDSRPLWGDEVAYAYTIPDINALQLSLIYSDGVSQLYIIN